MVTNMNNIAEQSSGQFSLTKDELWGKCLLYIKDRIQEQAFQTLFYVFVATNLNEEGITLQVPNQFHFSCIL